MKFASNNLHNLQQLVEGDPSFLWILPELKDDYIQPAWMNKLIAELQDTEFTKPALVKLLRSFAKKEGVHFGRMMQQLRALLSNQKDGYQIAEMFEILGKKATIKRLSRTQSDQRKKVENTN